VDQHHRLAGAVVDVADARAVRIEEAILRSRRCAPEQGEKQS
jgi:hypothetical protein